jgi:succinyl-CoA synthetase beta subunit
MTAGDVEDKICEATSAILELDRIRGLIIGVNISAFAPVPIRVRGIARALRSSTRDLYRFPIVIRLAGPRDDEAAEIMREFPDVHYFRDEVTLEEAVARFMRLVEEART